jgi:hypothetical protein
MIANPNKIIHNEKSDSDTSEIDDLLKDSDSSNRSYSSSRSSSSSKSSRSSRSSRSNKVVSESKNTFEKIMVSPRHNHQSPQQPMQPPPIPVLQRQTQVVTPVQIDKPLTVQEVRMKKIEMLRKLCEIKTKGFSLSKEYDFNSSLEEMEYEYQLLRSFADKRNGVKVFKGGLLQAVSVVEFLNDKYDPFDFHLSGWGEHMSVEIDSWEDVLEEIYEKYKGSGKKMAPEIKLLYLIIASASAFHFTKSHASKLPGLDSVLASNPGLLSKLMNPGKSETSQFMTPQELNIEKQREVLKKKEVEMKQQQASQQSYIQQLQQQIQNQQRIINDGENKTISASLNPNMFNSGHPLPSNIKLPPQQIPVDQLRPSNLPMRAPDEVKDILNRIHNFKESTIKPSNTETQDDSSTNNDRIVSETTISENNPRKKAVRKQKKSNISIL